MGKTTSIPFHSPCPPTTNERRGSGILFPVSAHIIHVQWGRLYRVTRLQKKDDREKELTTFKLNKGKTFDGTSK